MVSTQTHSLPQTTPGRLGIGRPSPKSQDVTQAKHRLCASWPRWASEARLAGNTQETIPAPTGKLPRGRISEGNRESESLKSRSSLPDQRTYLTHDVFIVRQCQSEVCDISIIALMEQRESTGARVGRALPSKGPLVTRTEEAVGLSHGPQL